MALVRFLLRRRYRVRIVGAESVSNVAGRLLILPNHPAYIDPALILSYLPFQGQIRPLVYVDTFRHPALRRLVRSIDALEVPDLRRDGRVGRDQVLQVIRQVTAGLDRGERFLLYPSGRLQRGQFELLGNARAVHEILRCSPDTPIVLVRTRGVWGSMFSCAATGDVPDLTRMLWRAATWLVLGFGCMPKRDVTLNCTMISSEEFKAMSRDELNRWLEAWYNSDGGESPEFVRYHFFTRRRRAIRETANGTDRCSQWTAEDHVPTVKWRLKALSLGQQWRAAARRKTSPLFRPIRQGRGYARRSR